MPFEGVQVSFGCSFLRVPAGTLYRPAKFALTPPCGGVSLPPPAGQGLVSLPG